MPRVDLSPDSVIPVLRAARPIRHFNLQERPFAEAKPRYPQGGLPSHVQDSGFLPFDGFGTSDPSPETLRRSHKRNRALRERDSVPPLSRRA